VQENTKHKMKGKRRNTTTRETEKQLDPGLKSGRYTHKRDRPKNIEVHKPFACSGIENSPVCLPG
jgi:hypothetical protein